MSTDTPRTDAEEYPEAEGRDFNVVSADFARTLERELARMERLRFGADADRRLLRGELEKERAVSADHVSLYKERVALAEKYLTALAAEKGKVRVLRDALVAIDELWPTEINGSVHHTCNQMQKVAVKALAATETTP